MADINVTVASQDNINVTLEGASAPATFLELTDTPATYSGNTDKFVRVNSAGTALEFVTSAASVAWGAITGTLSDQTDLQTALNAKQDNISVSDTSEIDLTFTSDTLSAALVAGSIDETKLDTSVNASLDLADSALQSGDNISELTNDSAYITGNETITFSGDVTGSGTTAITTTIASGAVDIAMLSATGTPSSSTFLRGDNVWATPAGGFSDFDLGGDSGVNITIDSGDLVDIVGGTGVDTTVSKVSTTGTLSIALDSATQTSLGLADSALQSGDNISELTNDSGYITSTLTQEQVEDYVGAMFAGNTETLITATYQDVDGTIDLVVDNNLANYDNSSSGFITATLTQEEVEDYAGALVATGGTKTGISVTYQDATGDMDFVTDVTLTGSETLTNKTIDGDNNTLSNLDIGNEVDWAAAVDVDDRTAFASGDKLLIFEAGVGMRKVDYDDLPGAGGGLANIVEDTTPQLGGALDGQGNDLNNLGVIFLTEQAEAEVDVAGKGQIWVDTATPNVLKFTDDAGTDFSIANFENLASTSNALGASLIGIEDSGTLITATTVEGALAENRTAIDAIEADYLTSSAIGSTVQAYDADLDTWAGLTPSANAQSLVTAANYAAMRALLDLEIGTDVLAQQTIGITNDNLLEVDGTPNALEYARFTANGLEGRTEAEFKADFNLEIGTDVQAYNSVLDTYVSNALDATELAELQNIGATTISATQWGYLGALNQGLTTTSDVTFADITYTTGVGSVSALGNLGATEAIDWATASHFTGTLDSNVTITHSNETAGQKITIALVYDGTAQRTITWSDVDKWAGGSAPTAPSSSGEELVVTLIFLGTTCYGSYELFS